MNIYSVHLSPDNFDNPEAFKPERFIENGAHVPDKKLILFGGGNFFYHEKKKKTKFYDEIIILI